MLLKIIKEPPFELVSSNFMTRSLPAVVDATKAQLQAADERRQELHEETRELQEVVEARTREYDELRRLRDEEVWFPIKETNKTETRYKKASGIADLIQSHIDVASKELHHLRSTIGEEVIRERGAFQKKKSDMVTERDRLAIEAREKRALLIEKEEMLRDLRAKAKATERAADTSEGRAAMVPALTDKFKALHSQWTTLQEQVAEKQAKLQRGKSRSTSRRRR